jgi:uncharacterized protein (DUF2235 family)
MLQKVGLLSPSKFDQLQSTYDMYERDDEVGHKLSAQFKLTTIDVEVKFLGVWYVIRPLDQSPISFPCRDTVESIGVNSKSLPFSSSSNTVKVFRHALSLDEHRVKFTPSFCTDGKPKGQRTEQETDVKEVFFAGAHSGTLWFSLLQSVRYSWVPFQTSGADF